MKNNFPQIEIPTFEFYTGKIHKDSHPNENAITHNMKKNQEIEIDAFSNEKIPANSWLQKNAVSEVERNSLPLFVKDEEKYISVRNHILELYNQNPNKYLSIRDVKLNVDSIFLINLFTFLEKWKLINARIRIKENKTIEREFDDFYIQPDTFKCICGENDTLYFPNDKMIFYCQKCIKSGKYDTKYSSRNFNKLNYIHYDNLWSKTDEYVLFDSVLKFESWSEIANAVGKSVESCILHFLRKNIKYRTIENNIDLIHSSVISNMSNPVMNFVTFLTANVHPKLGSDAANWILKNLHERNFISKELFEFTVEKAKELKGDLDQNKDKLMAILIDLHMQRMELKMAEYEEGLRSIEKERKDLEFTRSNYAKKFEEIKKMCMNNKK